LAKPYFFGKKRSQTRVIWLLWPLNQEAFHDLHKFPSYFSVQSGFPARAFCAFYFLLLSFFHQNVVRKEKKPIFASQFMEKQPFNTRRVSRKVSAVN
jgi:hypothetical protein